MRAEDGGRESYDFSNAKPNPYAQRIREHGSNLVVIEPDLFAIFPDSDAVNDALRLLVKVGRKAMEEGVPKADVDEHLKAS